MPNKFLYKPWELEIKYQEQIKVVIGVNYPKPIVDHAEARNAALELLKQLRKTNHLGNEEQSICFVSEFYAQKDINPAKFQIITHYF